MLELKNITKEYHTGGETVHALRGIDLKFRKNEFVAILGPSGCGKTTMLNIVGGLDSYTSGDLIINGKSTKDFRDRDWDGYRNHSIGFVFQSYNLIPHQTVLNNVELALTLSGVARKERRQRAKTALEKVGLEKQLRKHPNEMSGGQMQRVAIARAIVNNPDIILADEPTGALDTETGIQVMEILKELASDRLIIMVTHNPELAQRYATRTITMLDGVITGDSNPVTDLEYEELTVSDQKALEAHKGRKVKLPTMSALTSFSLSLKNLFTKKGRTILTSFAGSIGIIGIALIYAVSNGATTYINMVQEEALTAYPLSLESETVELSSLIETFLGKAQSDDAHENDAIYQKAMIYSLVNSLNSIETSENDLAAFKTYLEERMADEEDESGLRDAVSGVQYTYGLDLDIYTKNVDGEIIRSDISTLMRQLIIENMTAAASQGSSMFSTGSTGTGSSLTSMMSGSTSSSYSTLFQEMLPGKNGKLISDVFDAQYDLIYGSWPNDYNEVVLVVDEKNEIADLSLYALGFLPKEDVQKIFTAVQDKSELDITRKSWSYEEICKGDYRIVIPCNCYSYNAETGEYDDLRDTDAGIQYLYSNAISLRVSGIIRAKEGATTTILNGSIGYTSKLSEYIINEASSSEIAKAQSADRSKDIFSGLYFRSSAENFSVKEKADLFRQYIAGLSEADKAQIYVNIMSIVPDGMIQTQVDAMLSGMSRADIENMITQSLQGQISVDTESLTAYIAAMSDEDLEKYVRTAMEERFSTQYAEQIKQGLSTLSDADLAKSLEAAVGGYTDELCAEYYDETAEFSESNADSNLVKLGCIDMGEPKTINIYASTFADKDAIKDAIAAYNADVDDVHEIKYTDYVGIMMSSITTIIDAITYVLIAFVAISLIVSSIMIGVITLISVQERTKEIGILRAIGASKKNVSGMFNAETLIIGFTSGIIGVGFTYLVCIPINLILHALTGIPNLSASLPLLTAAVLVAISMILTLIAGIIPSRSAARKDPVIALRTE